MRSVATRLLRAQKKLFSATCNKRAMLSGQILNTTDFSSVDHNFDKDRLKKTELGEDNSRDFTYFLLGADRMVFASLARLTLVKSIASMSASADVLALATAEFDISGIEKGSTVTFKWRGQPVFVRHRTEHEIELARAADHEYLPDPQLDQDRIQDPDWLVVVGICTHLGCVPISGAGEYQGWFCPCHGSHYDTSGRIRKGPAPQNLQIPPYKLEGSTKLTVG